MKCERCQSSTVELALIKIEVDQWERSVQEGFGQITAPMRMQRIAQRFHGFELIAHPADGTKPPAIELRFPEGHEWMSMRELTDPPPAPSSAQQRSSMRTLFEFRTRSWVKWLVLPIAWALSVLVAWWVLH